MVTGEFSKFAGILSAALSYSRSFKKHVLKTYCVLGSGLGTKFSDEEDLVGGYNRRGDKNNSRNILWRPVREEI